MSDLLLDTCAILWASGAAEGAGRTREILQKAYVDGARVAVSPISAWELGNLVVRNRLRLTQPPLVWFEAIVARGGLELVGLTPAILVDSTALPDLRHRDPADRILIATARTLGLRILTGDREILDYADSGHVLALPC